jgi:Uma2 family endonuclease
MPSAVLEQLTPGEPRRKRWTRAECVALEEAGIWEQQKIELVNGELISKMGKNRPHVYALVLLQGWLVSVFGLQFVSPESPIDVAPEDNSTNEPEPDLIVLERPIREIMSGNPRPADIRLLVEISDSTLGFDLRVKAPLYARAGIVEYWVVDISARRIIVHRDPREGAYHSVEAYSEQETVRPLGSPNDAFSVRDAFPG